MRKIVLFAVKLQRYLKN